MRELQPTCKDFPPKENQAASWVPHKWNWQVPRLFLMVKRGRGACQFQWRVGPSYCEYPGVTYNLLVSNIGGTYDLADQLPSNRELGHFLVASQSQVPWELGVNLALMILIYFIRSDYNDKRSTPSHDIFTLKKPGIFFQNVVLFSYVFGNTCNILVWNLSDTMNILSALCLLIAWCSSTRINSSHSADYGPIHFQS